MRGAEVAMSQGFVGALFGSVLLVALAFACGEGNVGQSGDRPCDAGAPSPCACSTGYRGTLLCENGVATGCFCQAALAGDGAVGNPGLIAGDGAAPDASSAGGGAEALGETAACVEYMRAQCERKAECGLYASFEACFFQDVSLCPDYLFAPGSTRGIDDTLACAEAWRDAQCDDVRRGLPLACATPGTRQPGEACISGPQCASRVCSGRIDTCGTCRAVAADGEACVAGTQICELGFSCDAELALCVRYFVPPLRPQPEPSPAPDAMLPVPGQACSERCASDASCVCIDASCSARRCQLIRAPGDPCDPAAFESCADGVSHCQEGRCQLVESQGAFARLCEI
jgi:hypothetical protein